MSLAKVKHIVLVLSGKGGVGKSSVTTQLALSLSLAGHSVGVLDVDLTGPSMPRMFNIEDAKVTQAPGGWLPVPVHGANPEAGVGELRCMSLGFLLRGRGDAVVWRGPKKTAMVRQFLSDVLWGEVDYLLIDTPPGTSDEHISLAETLLKDARPGQVAGAVVVTTPQAVATATKGGGQVMAQEFNVRFLDAVPIDPQFVMLIETGNTPTYPQGTLINGQDVSQGAGQHADGPATKDASLLAEKYRNCSLEPIFRKITRDMITAIG
ncbi:hypothetical protein G7054_g11699 [Neopestalotiopsis clavispora]|nr:hypothetical protein G7054_g11699 [Neopestalotiopsis clavispora]